jgi:signal transduction histidine kinase
MKSYFINILFNLVLNAVIYKHPDRDILVSVHSVPTKANGIKIIVSDNGMGIDLNDEKKERMFAMYGRLQHNTEGSGLGLYLVKTQVEALGGRIEVNSTLDKGTSFTIRLNTNLGAKISNAL